MSNTKSNKAAKHQCTTFPSHKATAASATSKLRWPDEETRVVMVGAENVGTESGDRKGVPVCQKNRSRYIAPLIPTLRYFSS